MTTAQQRQKKQRYCHCYRYVLLLLLQLVLLLLCTTTATTITNLATTAATSSITATVTTTTTVTDTVVAKKARFSGDGCASRLSGDGIRQGVCKKRGYTNKSRYKHVGVVRTQHWEREGCQQLRGTHAMPYSRHGFNQKNSHGRILVGSGYADGSREHKTR